MRVVWPLPWLLLAAVTTANGDTLDDVRAAIGTSTGWQERWFGESFGASCVRAAAKRGAPLRVLLRDSEFAPGAQISTRSFAAYVDGTNVLYTGEVWDGKAYAEPSAGDPTSCKPGEITNQTQFPDHGGTVLTGAFSMTANRAPAEISEEQRTKIDKMARRSVEAYLGASSSERLRVANYHLDDPALIVLAERTGRVLLVNFPPVALIDPNTTASVFNGEIFLGPDASAGRKRNVAKHVRDELSKNSRQLN